MSLGTSRRWSRFLALRGSAALWRLPAQERRDAIWQESKERPLDEVRERAGQTFAALLKGLETLTEEDLHESSRFADMPFSWIPWQVIATNTYEHYQYHIAQVQAWLKKQREQQEREQREQQEQTLSA